MITNTDYILSLKSKGLSDESFKPPATSDDSLNPALNHWKLFKTIQNYIYSWKSSKHL